jgi:ATP-dependent DNA helicase RecG
MNEQTLINLVKKGESDTIEFKTSFDKEAIETLAAFANTKGGTIVIGVQNSGQLFGVQLGKETLQNWTNQIKLHTAPSIAPDVSTITIKNKTMVIFKIIEYPVKPISCKGKYFKRIQNSNHQMSIHEIFDLHLKTHHSSWDHYYDTQHTLEDISLDKVNRFIELANKIRPYPIMDDPMTVLRKFELLQKERITHGCYLLFTAEDSLLSTIEIGRFASETTIKDSLTIRKDLIAEVEKVLEFIHKHMGRSYIISGKAQREERWEYPLDALREIVVNMIVHRDYMSSNDSVIKIFDDHISFFNPGNLPEGLTINQLIRGDYSPSIRNKQIATVFKEGGIIEKYGSGIKRVLEAFNKYELPQPVFKETQKGFKVTVFKTTQKITQKIQTRDQILELLGENPKMTREGLARALEKSPNTIKGHIAKLKAEGKLKRIGSDRNGYWEVMKGTSMIMLKEKDNCF